MHIERPEISLLDRAFDDLVAGKGSTVLIAGEPGIGKSTLVQKFLDGCDSHHELNVLTATGRCIDLDGISRGYLPWKEVLIELDADRAAGKDAAKKKSFASIVKTLFDESGSEWIQNIPQIGEISAAILKTAHAIEHAGQFDVTTGESRDLSFRERLSYIARECTGAWIGAIPIVGGLAEAAYKTSVAMATKRQEIQMKSQEDFFVLVMTRLRQLAHDNPVVVFLDDLQWADASSLSLFLYLAKNIQDKTYPLLLIGSYRPEDLRRGRYNPQTGEMDRHPFEEKLNTLLRYDACAEIHLASLDRAQFDLLLRHRFGRYELDDATVDELLDATGGNFLFMQEMLTNLLERGILVERDGSLRRVGQLDYSLLPRTVQGVIKERYERLSEDLRELIDVAAVEGEEFALEIVGAILGKSSYELGRKVESLIKKHGIVRSSTHMYDRLTKVYEFTHDLVQKYIYYSIEEGVRRDMHRAIAGVMKGMLDEEETIWWLAMYGFHLGVGSGIIDEHRAIRLDDSVPPTGRVASIVDEYMTIEKRLAEHHIATYNNAEAIRACEQIVELARITGDVDTRIEFLGKKGKVLETIGKWDDAMAHYRERLELAIEAKNRMEEAESRGLLGLGLRVQAKYDEALEQILMARDYWQEVGDPVKWATTIHNIGLVYHDQGEFDRALEYYREAEAISREMQDESVLARAINNIGVIHNDRREYGLALEYYREKEAICRRTGDKRGLQTATRNIGNVYYFIGQYDRALEYYRECEALCRQTGDRLELAKARGSIGVVYFQRGEYTHALECYREREAISRELGDRRLLSVALDNIGLLYLRRREFDRALECFAEDEAICHELGDRSGAAGAIGNRGEVYLKRSEYDRALECYQQQKAICLERGDEGGAAVATARIGIVHGIRGEYAAALDCYRVYEAVCRQVGRLSGLVEMLDGIGSAYLRLGDYDAALENFAEQESISRELGDGRHLVMAMGNIGRVYENRGQLDRALESFERAINEQRSAEDRTSLPTWLEGFARVLLSILDGDEMPGWLPAFVLGARESNWRARSLEHARTLIDEAITVATELADDAAVQSARELRLRIEELEKESVVTVEERKA